ncbi:MAG: hypothetical protein J1F28_10620 [Oscillospiraceae bacterium]|nr:hypothetical protein [Oscillospiraceae bacterium]
MNGTINVLDCTLRDGGQGLEDLNKYGFKTEEFTENDRIRIAELARDAGIDIIEIGTISEIHGDDQKKFAIYRDVQTLSRFKPGQTSSDRIYTGLYLGPDIPVDKIPEYSPELVDGIRVILRYSELKKSVDFCAAIAKKNYKVFVQPMLTMRYTDDEINYLVDSANEMGAYALYFVDSFGYMTEKDVDRFANHYLKRLDKGIKIGFHAHNNMENAFLNVKYFIETFPERERIIDSCAVGMGTGTGNLQTEVLVNYLNKNSNTDYDFEKVLEICEILEKFRPAAQGTWGYTPLRFIPAAHNTSYKFAVAMRMKYNMTFVQINRVMSEMPDELRFRYTPEILEKILSDMGFIGK